MLRANAEQDASTILKQNTWAFAKRGLLPIENSQHEVAQSRNELRKVRRGVMYLLHDPPTNRFVSISKTETSRQLLPIEDSPNASTAPNANDGSANAKPIRLKRVLKNTDKKLPGGSSA